MIQEPMRDKVLLGALLCRCDMYSACGRCCLEQTVGIDADPSAAGDDDDDAADDDDDDDDDDDHDEAEEDEEAVMVVMLMVMLMMTPVRY